MFFQSFRKLALMLMAGMILATACGPAQEATPTQAPESAVDVADEIHFDYINYSMY